MDFNALLAEARRDPKSRGASSAGPSGGQDKEQVLKFWGVGNSAKKQKLSDGKNIKVIGSDAKAEARLASMHMVVPGVWVGAEEAAEDVENLKENLVTHIVALTGRKPSHGSKDFDYLLLDTIDDSKYPLNNHFEEAIRFMKEALDNDTAVLVHCAAGMSRGPSIVIAYLIAVQGMTYQDAFALVREKRPITCPNEGFRAQLRTFEETMRQKKEASSADSEALQKEVWDLKDRIAQLEKQLTLNNKRHEEFVLELMEDYSVEKKMRMIREEHKRVEAEKEREKIAREQKEKEEKEKKDRTDRLREEREAILARKQEQVRTEKVVNTGKGKEKVKEEEKKDEGETKKEGHTSTFVAFSGEGRSLNS